MLERFRKYRSNKSTFTHEGSVGPFTDQVLRTPGERNRISTDVNRRKPADCRASMKDMLTREASNARSRLKFAHAYYAEPVRVLHVTKGFNCDGVDNSVHQYHLV